MNNVAILHAHASAIYDEHLQLLGQLDQLDAALEKLFCHSELFSDLATVNQAIAGGKWLAEYLPRHYYNEETTVFATVAAMSPDLAAFTREMRIQHKQFRLRLENLREMLNHLPMATDLEGAVSAVKRAGRDFTRDMRLHLAAEDSKFASLEN